MVWPPIAVIGAFGGFFAAGVGAFTFAFHYSSEQDPPEVGNVIVRTRWAKGSEFGR